MRLRTSLQIGRLALRGARLTALLLCLVAAMGAARRGVRSLRAANTAPSYSGVLTFSSPGNGDPFHPATILDMDLATGDVTVRFNGLDGSVARSGETAFLQRVGGGLYADHAVVVADARGVPGPPLFVCREFRWSDNRVCRTPKVAPNGRLVAFSAMGGGGTVCRDNYDMYFGSFVIVRDRRGAELARYEGFYDPEWMPDGRLLMMGSGCRNAGVWVTDAALRGPSRVDGGQVATPASAPVVSPDGRRLAFVWNQQLWAMPLVGRPELTQLTRLGKSVTAGAWSPDGQSMAAVTYDVSMPMRLVVLFRPGDPQSAVVRQLSVYPYGPLSWR
ncbi:WD40-like beta Propeller containing protein [Gemmatirosa kalamazoonensis]|uniref:WD40-like beta Propeller containing protein n=1 Tax=Gemmatirosa kalamazoonensis TaxID=861299 RepID=W0RAP1_9BACT|nr:PD40 domain-containing protein [Gemmatirosa kalamazoonensis]AHG87851.1 WD40-like beta Propeller containing protein [Gemmatirosa kalamazoonensis]